MNYRIPRAMCLDANYPMKNDPFMGVRVHAGVRVKKLTWTSWCHTFVDSYVSFGCLTQQHTRVDTVTDDVPFLILCFGL